MYLTYTNDTNAAEEHLRQRSDPRAGRVRDLLALPDLTRTSNSPVRFVVEAVMRATALAGCDVVEVPRIVPVERNFDLLQTPADHPSRRPSDTYYVSDTHVLRTHTTAFWPYYLRDPQVLRRLDAGVSVAAVCYGTVYRNDDIDRNHHSAFHQIDGLCLCRSERRVVTQDELAGIVTDIARCIYGPDVACRVTPDTFPFTHPSIQLEVQWREGWLEVMGAGLVHPTVLAALGLDPAVYNGWAFGFGLERLAMARMGIPDIRVLWLDDERVSRQFTGLDAVYREVSRYPATVRDVSMLVDESLALRTVYEAMRECGQSNGEQLIEEVTLADRYRSAAFGAGKESRTFRVVYRSHTRTLTTEEVNRVQEGLRSAMVREFGAVLR
jgi:phenylalanyl-tRNA synthetase alpha chain